MVAATAILHIWLSFASPDCPQEGSQLSVICTHSLNAAPRAHWAHGKLKVQCFRGAAMYLSSLVRISLWAGLQPPVDPAHPYAVRHRLPVTPLQVGVLVIGWKLRSGKAGELHSSTDYVPTCRCLTEQASFPTACNRVSIREAQVAHSRDDTIMGKSQLYARRGGCRDRNENGLATVSRVAQVSHNCSQHPRSENLSPIYYISD